MSPTRLRVRIVLVRPRNPGNIGACARAMKNFGLTELVVVDPYTPIWEETRAAPDAEDIVHKARKVATLQQALTGCKRIFGTSSLAHRTLEQLVISLPEMHAHLAPRGEKQAIVFGSERSGLSNDELTQCHAILHIPMAHTKISMNLAQAVAVTLYELTRPASTPSADSHGFLDKQDLIAEWIRLATAVGYPPGYTAPARAGRIRRAMGEAHLSADAARFMMSFSRWILKKVTR